MEAKMKWEGIDIVASCVQSSVAVNFKANKRFYRLRLREGCGIYDMQTCSILRTTEEIFSEGVEAQYRYAGNRLKGIEAIASQCGRAYS